MFHEELDALFATAIGALIGVGASVILCIIFVVIPDTGMTARNFAWVLLSSLGTAFASGFLMLWMSRRTIGDQTDTSDDSGLHGSSIALKTDSRMNAAERGR